MTRKDFEDIAFVIRNASIDNEQKKELVLNLCAVFIKKNVRFDMAKFLNKCGALTD